MRRRRSASERSSRAVLEVISQPIEGEAGLFQLDGPRVERRISACSAAPFAALREELVQHDEAPFEGPERIKTLESGVKPGLPAQKAEHLAQERGRERPGNGYC